MTFNALPAPAASVLILLATIVLVLLLDVSGKRKYVRQVTLTGFISAFAALFFLPLTGTILPMFKIDLFTFFFTALFLLIGLLVILASNESTAAYYASMILSVLGMIFASSANDVVLLFISIELVTAPTYVLVAYHKTYHRMKAAVKYFIVGIVSSALLLFGLALLVAMSGTTSISDMLSIVTAINASSGSSLFLSPLFLLGIAAVIAGLGFKLSVFPFYFWVPDVYQGAPPEVAGFLAAASKKAAYAVLLRLAVVFVLVLKSWVLLFAILAALTMTIPNIIALTQYNVRRLLAYSILSHAGFLLMGVAIATKIGYSATLFHSFTHAFMTLGAFLILAVFHAHRQETIDQFKGLGWKNPLLGTGLTIFLLSLAGIPLLSGFASKVYLFYATIDAGLLWLAILAILNSALSLFYYFRIIKSLYSYDAQGAPYPLRRGMKIAILLCLLVTIVIGIYPDLFIRAAVLAAGALG